MRLKSKVPLITTVCIITLNVLFSYLLYSFSYQPILEKVKLDKMSKVVLQIETLLQEHSNRAAGLADLFAELSSMKKLVQQADRQGLIDLLQPMYTIQHERYGVNILDIITPDNKMLLRLHNLKKFGDDTSDRGMVIAVTRRQKTENGIEIGRSGIAIRALSPLKSQGKFIGIVEIGLPFDDIINTIKTTTGFEMGVFIHQALLTETATNLSPPESDDLIGGMRVLYRSNWNKIRPALSATLLRTIHETLTLTETIEGRSTGIILTPLQDFSGKTIGVIVAVCEFENVQLLENEFLWDILFLAALQIILLTGLILIIFQGWVLSPLRDLAERLEMRIKRLKQNKISNKEDFSDLPFNQLLKRKDEVGDVARYVKLSLNTKIPEVLDEAQEENAL